MMRPILAIVFLAVSSFASENFTEKTFKPFFEQIKNGKYEEGITALVKGSVLQDKVLGVKQTKDNWIDQFKSIKNAYGEFLSYEKIHESNLGKLSKLYYLVYCKTYAIKVEATIYDMENKNQLVNFDFDDKIVKLIDDMEMLKGFSGHSK
jgi:hypothetical protein